jgi:hypothetical protein
MYGESFETSVDLKDQKQTRDGDCLNMSYRYGCWTISRASKDPGVTNGSRLTKQTRQDPR